MSKRNWALVAATLVSIIYGVTFTIAKDVMPKYVEPFGFITMRVGGSVILFWLISFFGPKEKIALEDFPDYQAAGGQFWAGWVTGAGVPTGVSAAIGVSRNLA